jgi:hypothetical protein
VAAAKKGGLKGLWESAKKSPAILVAGIFLVLVVGYLVIKNQGSNQPGGTSTGQPGTNSNPNANGPGYFFMYNEEVPGAVTYNNNMNTVTAPAPAPAPPPTTITKTVQKPYTPAGVTSYILGQPNKGRSLVDQIEQQQRQAASGKPARKTFIKAPVVPHSPVVGKPVPKR